MLLYLSEAEEEADATAQLEGIVDRALQLAHARRTLTLFLTAIFTTGSLQHGKHFSARLLR
jgi:hypothetical protein